MHLPGSQEVVREAAKMGVGADPVDGCRDLGFRAPEGFWAEGPGRMLVWKDCSGEKALPRERQKWGRPQVTVAQDRKDGTRARAAVMEARREVPLGYQALRMGVGSERKGEQPSLGPKPTEGGGPAQGPDRACLQTSKGVYQVTLWLSRCSGFWDHLWEKELPGAGTHTDGCSPSSSTSRGGGRCRDEGLYNRKVRTGLRRALTFLPGSLLIHSIAHQSFLEHLLCARPRTRDAVGM